MSETDEMRPAGGGAEARNGREAALAGALTQLEDLLDDATITARLEDLLETSRAGAEKLGWWRRLGMWVSWQDPTALDPAERTRPLMGYLVVLSAVLAFVSVQRIFYVSGASALASVLVGSIFGLAVYCYDVSLLNRHRFRGEKLDAMELISWQPADFAVSSGAFEDGIGVPDELERKLETERRMIESRGRQLVAPGSPIGAGFLVQRTLVGLALAALFALTGDTIVFRHSIHDVAKQEVIEKLTETKDPDTPAVEQRRTRELTRLEKPLVRDASNKLDPTGSGPLAKDYYLYRVRLAVQPSIGSIADGRCQHFNKKHELTGCLKAFRAYTDDVTRQRRLKGDLKDDPDDRDYAADKAYLDSQAQIAFLKDGTPLPDGVEEPPVPDGDFAIQLAHLWTYGKQNPTAYWVIGFFTLAIMVVDLFAVSLKWFMRSSRYELLVAQRVRLRHIIDSRRQWQGEQLTGLAVELKARLARVQVDMKTHEAEMLVATSAMNLALHQRVAQRIAEEGDAALEAYVKMSHENVLKIRDRDTRANYEKAEKAIQDLRLEAAKVRAQVAALIADSVKTTNAASADMAQGSKHWADVITSAQAAMAAAAAMTEEHAPAAASAGEAWASSGAAAASAARAAAAAAVAEQAMLEAEEFARRTAAREGTAPPPTDPPPTDPPPTDPPPTDPPPTDPPPTDPPPTDPPPTDPPPPGPEEEIRNFWEYPPPNTGDPVTGDNGERFTVTGVLVKPHRELTTFILTATRERDGLNVVLKCVVKPRHAGAPDRRQSHAREREMLVALRDRGGVPPVLSYRSGPLGPQWFALPQYPENLEMYWRRDAARNHSRRDLREVAWLVHQVISQWLNWEVVKDGASRRVIETDRKSMNVLMTGETRQYKGSQENVPVITQIDLEQSCTTLMDEIRMTEVVRGTRDISSPRLGDIKQIPGLVDMLYTAGVILHEGVTGLLPQDALFGEADPAEARDQAQATMAWGASPSRPPTGTADLSPEGVRRQLLQMASRWMRLASHDNPDDDVQARWLQDAVHDLGRLAGQLSERKFVACQTPPEPRTSLEKEQTSPLALAQSLAVEVRPPENVGGIVITEEDLVLDDHEKKKKRRWQRG